MSIIRELSMNTFMRDHILYIEKKIGRNLLDKEVINEVLFIRKLMSFLELNYSDYCNKISDYNKIIDKAKKEGYETIYDPGLASTYLPSYSERLDSPIYSVL